MVYLFSIYGLRLNSYFSISSTFKCEILSSVSFKKCCLLDKILSRCECQYERKNMGANSTNGRLLTIILKTILTICLLTHNKHTTLTIIYKMATLGKMYVFNNIFDEWGSFLSQPEHTMQ